MTKDVVKEILELTEHLAKAQQALFALRKYGIFVKIEFENGDISTFKTVPGDLHEVC